jgi:histidyl-tRNA synthetase
MAIQKPSAPQGMRDFGPDEMVRRNYIFNTIRKVYEKYGFVQIETPAMEKLETLTGKYGEEGDKLIFKVLNSGNFFKGSDAFSTADDQIYKLDMGRLSDEERKTVIRKSFQYCEKALKYDLTVPFARFVVQYNHELKFPFKRYQIQPVWRADSTGKGRYREFYQCDADVVGSDSLLNEIDFVQIYNEVLNGLQLTPYVVKMNHRKILSGFAEVIGGQDRLIPFTVALDKLDKIGKDKVLEELQSKGFTPSQLNKIAEILEIKGNTAEKLGFLKTYFANSEVGLKGVEEIEQVFTVSETLGLQNGELELDLTLARGLDYYTGCIFEATIPGAGMGSISGGGRYDDLTGIFGMPGLSGVGISFGADRIYDILLAQHLFPAFNENKTEFLFLNFGPTEALASLKLVHTLRQHGKRAVLYPDAVKIKKQMGFANDTGVTYVCTMGPEEIIQGKVGVKNMQTGEQVSVGVEEFINEQTNKRIIEQTNKRTIEH